MPLTAQHPPKTREPSLCPADRSSPPLPGTGSSQGPDVSLNPHPWGQAGRRGESVWPRPQAVLNGRHASRAHPQAPPHTHLMPCGDETCPPFPSGVYSSPRLCAFPHSFGPHILLSARPGGVVESRAGGPRLVGFSSRKAAAITRQSPVPATTPHAPASPGPRPSLVLCWAPPPRGRPWFHPLRVGDWVYSLSGRCGPGVPWRLGV